MQFKEELLNRYAENESKRGFDNQKRGKKIKRKPKDYEVIKPQRIKTVD